jgi:hypothetical protein
MKKVPEKSMHITLPTSKYFLMFFRSFQKVILEKVGPSCKYFNVQGTVCVYVVRTRDSAFSGQVLHKYLIDIVHRNITGGDPVRIEFALDVDLTDEQVLAFLTVSLVLCRTRNIV